MTNLNSITEEWLEANGWRSEIFFFAIGGGEDEDDMIIWEKDEIAVCRCRDIWYKSIRDNLSYTHGFPSNNIVYTIADIQ